MTREPSDRIRSFEEWAQERSATHLEGFSWGRVFLNEDLPKVWDLNFARVERPVDPSRIDDLIAEVDRAMTGLQHRQVWVEDEALGQMLEPPFSERGWRVDRHVVMALRRDPDRAPNASAVVRVDEDLVWPSREEWLRSYEEMAEEDTVVQLRGQYRKLNELLAGEDYGIVEEGRVVSFALLRHRAGVGEVTDVATLEPFRNRGLARAVMWRVVERSRELGCDLLFLIADDRDWPKEWYSRLGFDAVAYQYYFLLTGV